MRPKSCEEYRELILLGTAGGLDPRLKDELSDHLATDCTGCSEALEEATQLQVALSLGLDPVQPTASVKRRLLTRIGDSVAEEQSEAIPVDPVRLHWRLPASIAAGLALAAGIVIGVVLVGPAEDPATRVDLVAVRAERDALNEEIAELREELEIADEDLAELEAKLPALEAERALLRAPTTISLALHGMGDQPDAIARVFWDEAYSCYLRVENLEAAPDGAEYALWVETTEGGTILAGTFLPEATGDATLWVPLDDGIGTFKRAFVTLEHAEDDAVSPSDPSDTVVLEGLVPEVI
jgi:hypothetical protein